ncbi:hypothetical protein [Gluconobacter frateurii]|uniref:Primase C-terminal 1 domain-containing protein n=1 Tax=Gluconobacter frateurii NRIC 0228 TaxID=1307946 RepID=A0ABQ0QFS6_9PROT|nr:hypothetical protein [Gluconobacter frateurii]GBR17508.1 hypothetical protein AA0228_3045 [Gluconobacter frateurii NRIC 0228]GLP89623.1 hypothetical protein GCM10007868_06980 [Gluconobacter frateurii]
MNKFILIKNIQCGSYDSPNFISEFDYSDMEQLAKTVINYGKWDGKTKKENLPLIALTTFRNEIKASKANPTNLLGLDFDDETNKISEVLEFFKDYSYFFYTSHSHTEHHHKFRIILELDCEINDNSEARLLSDIIKNRLSEKGILIDTACKDISRRFFIPSLDKQGNDPDMQFNIGNQYQVGSDLELSLMEEIKKEKLRELQAQLQRDKLRYAPPKKDLRGKWKQDAKDRFLADRSHNQLIKLVGNLRKNGDTQDEVISWIMLNYPSTGEDRHAEALRAWRWYDGKIA